MSRRGPRRRSPPGFRDVNITPLVDVMLVLLIVFLITAPLLTSKLDVDLPNVSAEPASVHDTRLVVSVTATGRILFGDLDVTEDLEQALAEDATVAAAKAIYVRADENVRYGVVARVVAAARSAGVSDLNLVVEPQPPKADR